MASSSRRRTRSESGQTPSKAALLAFTSSHLTDGDATALARRLAMRRQIALPSGEGEVADLAEIVSRHMDEATATECLQELRRRQEMGLPLVPRWA